MKRYRESLILMGVMILVGGGIYLMQSGGLLPDEPADKVLAGKSPLQNAVTKLDEIGQYTHDYLNGYLAGSRWGTALPAEALREEIDELQYQYEKVEEEVGRHYPRGSRLDSLLGEFFFGFEVLQGALTTNNKQLFTDAHKIFHRIDCEIFNHPEKKRVVP